MDTNCSQPQNCSCHITAGNDHKSHKEFHAELVKNAPYLALAFYHLSDIADAKKEVAEQKEFLSQLDARARIYISSQGINGQMSMSQKDAHVYMDWLAKRPAFEGVEFKLQPLHEHIFPRLTVKYKKELVALGIDVSIKSEDRGNYMTPEEWRKELDSASDKVIIDVRNDYEWKLGHFDGAELWECKTFKDFIASVDGLKKRIDTSKTKILMYCTGGIRCEIYSALLKKEGVDNIFQLHGGVIRYGEEESSKHWLGKLFVFDDRLAVDVSEDEPAPVIGTCHHCGKSSETYYNCANMDCNELFMCCPDCLEKFKGCCQESCEHAERVRPYQFSHKPFRKWYHYAKTKEELSTLGSCARKGE